MRVAVTAALVGIVLSAGAFQNIPISTIPKSLKRLPTDLSVSLSWISGRNVTEFSEGDEENNNNKVDRKLSRAPIKILPMDRLVRSTNGDDPQFNEFHQYLKRISLKIRNGKRRVNLMDNELKRMETKHFMLSMDGAQECQYEKSELSYEGPVFRAGSKAYSMVINAYTKSGLGTTAATLSEETARRYEEYNPGHHANAFMIRGIVKAWINAGNLDKAGQWIEKMDENYAITRSPDHAPDSTTYTLFLEALSSSSNPAAGDMSMKILRKMVKAYLSKQNLQIMPTNQTYQAVMKCQQKCHPGMTGVNKMHDVLKQQAAQYEEFGRPQRCKPGASSALPLIVLASEKRGNMQAIRIVEQCIEELQARFEETGDADYQPLDQIFTLLFSAYSKVNFKDALGLSEKVDIYLAMMERNQMSPSIYVTTAAIRTKVNDRSDRRLKEAEAMMRALERPDAFVYQSLLHGYCRYRNPEKADQLLQELDATFGADVISLGACISAWSQCTKFSDRALVRSEQILHTIVGRYRNGLVSPTERHVDAWVFEAVARLWLRSRKPECAERIIALIKDMEYLSKATPGHFLPTQTLYLLAFDALGAADDSGGRRTHELFATYESLSHEGSLPPPSVRLLSAVLASLTRSPGQLQEDDGVAVYYRMLQIIGEGKSTEKLDFRILTAVIRSTLGSKRKGVGDLAMGILYRTVTSARKNPDLIHLNTIAMNCILDAFVAKGCPDEAWFTFELMSRLDHEGFDTIPDAATFSFLAKSLAAARTPLTLERLDVVVEQVMQLYDKGSLSPDVHLFEQILIAYRNLWSLHVEAGGRAYDLLMWLEGLRGADDSFAPGIGSYRVVCEALAKSRTSNSLQMLEDIYKRARHLSKEGIIDTVDRDLCYAVVTGFVRQNDDRSLKKAEEIIAEMEFVRRHDSKSIGAPDVRVYNRVLFAYSSADTVGKATRAFALFSRMKSAYDQGDKLCKPNTHSYNALILAAAKTTPSMNMRDFNIAVAALKALHASTGLQSPSSTSYEYFLRACSRLTQDSASQKAWTHRGFAACRQRGLVTPLVIRLVCSVLPEIIHELEKAPRFETMGDRKLSEGSRNVFVIPASWCSGIPAKHRSQKVELSDRYADNGRLYY